LLVCQRK